MWFIIEQVAQKTRRLSSCSFLCPCLLRYLFNYEFLQTHPNFSSCELMRLKLKLIWKRFLHLNQQKQLHILPMFSISYANAFSRSRALANQPFSRCPGACARPLAEKLWNISSSLRIWFWQYLLSRPLPKPYHNGSTGKLKKPIVPSGGQIVTLTNGQTQWAWKGIGTGKALLQNASPVSN